MKIDITSFCFGFKILKESDSGTPAWSTSIGQAPKDICNIDEHKDGIQQFLIGMLHKAHSDYNNLETTNIEGIDKKEEPSSDRDRLTFSVFENVFINGIKVEEPFVLSIEKEKSKSHTNRMLLCYAKYLTYNGHSNKSTMTKMASILGSSENGCWFVYDISIKYQEELHFSAILVDGDSIQEYQDSKERAQFWNNLLDLRLKEERQYDLSKLGKMLYDSYTTAPQNYKVAYLYDFVLEYGKYFVDQIKAQELVNEAMKYVRDREFSISFTTEISKAYSLYKVIQSKNNNQNEDGVAILSESDTPIYTKPSSNPLQQIFYGAPGTGKSFEINRITKDEEVIRTTFHPDSDYSTFVGAYKPTSIEIPVRDVTGKVIVENGKQVTENRIVYEFVEQAFLQAYTNAWRMCAEETPKNQYLVIEEINRGNCAQIFGDLFQLLDRSKHGFSEYPITADKDMKKQLAKAFKDLTIANADKINRIFGKDIVSQVLSGEVLLLPSNLYIWATMNTSDQSLFPIDSAFKRRWDWKYMPICEGKDNGVSLGWKIKTKSKTYDWWQFVRKINAEIGEETKSEDKKLGYFFCKAQNGIIDAETFVGKVVFYLWNDVFKDQAFASDIFKDGDEELTFTKFYDVDVDGKTIVRDDKVELFLQNLNVDMVSVNGTIEIGDIEASADSSNGKKHLKEIQFPDGTIIDAGAGAFDAYINTIKKIGIEVVGTVADKLKFRRHGRPLISKEKYEDIESDPTYSYIQIGDYYFVKGAHAYTLVRMLEDIDEMLSVGLTIRTIGNF